MKVAFVVSHLGMFLRHFARVGRDLTSDGHSVTVVTVSGGGADDLKVSTHGIEAAQPGEASLQRAPPALHGDWKWQKLTTVTRGLRNYGFYLRPRHPSRGLARRAAAYLPRPIRIAAVTPLGKRVIVNESVQRLLRNLEKVVPAGRGVTKWLADNQPDVLVASPFIYPGPGLRQVGYVKAARLMGIPTVVPVASWDNLTTKGVFQVIPDLVLVWNRPLLDEAIELHHLPPDRIRVTGAPTFDFLFEMGPSLTRGSFGEKVGIDPARPFVVYLGSSTTISGDERPFVEQFARTLYQHPHTSDITVLIRPHPLNASIWRGFSAENAVVWPEGGQVTDSPESRNDYYNTLFHSVAAVGVNTSAFLEAAVVDKPCVSILTEHYREVQTELGHFSHLLDGHFMEIAHTFEESAELIGAVRRGGDAKAADRRRFVREFIRPWGMDKPASRIMAEIVEATARRDTVGQYSGLPSPDELAPVRE